LYIFRLVVRYFRGTGFIPFRLPDLRVLCWPSLIYATKPICGFAAREIWREKLKPPRRAATIHQRSALQLGQAPRSATFSVALFISYPSFAHTWEWLRRVRYTVA
jgi:hypothetical protein